jgi:hypothetical protein
MLGQKTLLFFMVGQKINQKIVTVKPATTPYMQTAERDYLAMHII